MSWNNVSASAEVQNLSDIMSKELSRGLQVKEEIKFAEEISDQHEHSSNDIPPELSKQIEQTSVRSYCDSDAIIAKVLQCQFDKEYDEEVKRVKKNKSGDAKVSVFYESYRHTPDHILYDSDSDYEDLDSVMNKDWDRYETNDKEFGARFVMKLCNSVFNHKQQQTPEQTKHHQTRKNKMLDYKESHPIAKIGLDEPTRLILFKLINNGVLEDINGVISSSKKSVILHANGNTSFPNFTVPKECAIKVFNATNEFKPRHRYIEADYRFKDRYSKQDRRKIVPMWAEKEMHNMKRLQKIGLNCPDVVCLKKHVLVMSFIGCDNKPARSLKEVILKQEKWQSIYNEVVDAMHKMYNVGHLIHANLSEYNILWWDNKCWFIGVSQSVQPDHPGGLKFLLKDCRNIAHLFKKKEVPSVKSAEDLFKSITGFEEIDMNMLRRVCTTYNSRSSRFEIGLDANTNTSYPFKLVKNDKNGDEDDEDKFEEIWMQSHKTKEVESAADFGNAIKVEVAPGTSPKIDKSNFANEAVLPKRDDDIGSTSIEKKS